MILCYITIYFSIVVEIMFFPFFLVFQTWIQEKKSVLATVQEVETKDLSSVITVQRRLNVIQRDLGALEDKVQFLA